MAEILRRFAAVILAFGCFISLASCGGNKVAENVVKTEPIGTTQAQAAEETSADEESSTGFSKALKDLGVTEGGDPYALPDNASQDRVGWVVNAGYGMVYNMYIDEDGIVHWCFDDEVNPRMTQQIQNFIVENGYSAAALYDYAVSEGISADMYMDTLVAMDPNNGASDIEESEALNAQQHLQDIETWYNNLFAMLDESYANRDSHDQVVFREQWDGSIVAEQQTTYDTMGIVYVEPCEYYTLDTDHWYWTQYTNEQGDEFIYWVYLMPDADGYLHAFYNTINGRPMVSWDRQICCAVRLDSPTNDWMGMDYADDLDADWPTVYMDEYVIELPNPSITSISGIEGVSFDRYDYTTMPTSSFTRWDDSDINTTTTELYEYTVNEIIPNL